MASALLATARPPRRVPTWPRSAWCSLLRRPMQAALRPPLHWLCRPRLRGADHLAGLAGPAIIVANHTSHLDTGVILAALPAALRRRTAVAAAADYFYTRPAPALLVGLLVNAFPLRRDGAAGGLLTVRALLDDGWSVLLYPEGTRSVDGALAPFRPGVGCLATRSGRPVVPIYLEGLGGVLPKGRRWPRRGRVTVSVGPPLRLPPRLAAAEAAHLIEAAVRALAPAGRPA